MPGKLSARIEAGAGIPNSAQRDYQIPLRLKLISVVRNAVKPYPNIKRFLAASRTKLGLIEHTAAQLNVGTIKPRPRRLTIAITASCNLRCVGCRYGRDFMPNAQLSLATVRALLDDAKLCGIELVRLYGGEPLLHRQLSEMVRHATNIGLSVYVTTNGTLLNKKIDELYEAGLRNLSIGFYGTNISYNSYVQRSRAFQHLETGVAAVKSRYGNTVSMQLNYLIMRPSCNLMALHEAWSFANKYDMTFHTDLVHYSLPYFSEGPDKELQFRVEDREQIEEVVRELVRLKKSEPARMTDSLPSLRSIPDWLLKGPDMRVPCDAHQLLWVGANGTVQLCYVTFRLGNLHKQRLRDMLFTDAHRSAASDAFRLACPNCHCERNGRI